MTLSFTPSHAEATLTYDKAMRERNRMLKDGITDPAWYDAIESQMADAGSEIERNRLATLDRLAAAQEGGISSFPAGDLTLRGAEGADVIVGAEALIVAYREGRRRDMAAGRTLAGPHRDDLQAVYRAKGVNARQCSTGEQKALLVSLILANARAVAQDFGAPPILLLDEVAAHLDADRRAALYDEICGLQAQAWMTGTGPELFQELSTRADILSVSEEGGISKILRVAG